MSIWNKVLLGFVIVAALAFCHAGMRTLKTHQYWRELTRQRELDTAKVAKENELLRNGSLDDAAKPVLGIKQYRDEIERLVEVRGRVWTNCGPKNANAQTGQVTVSTDRPVPNLISKEATLYVFEEKETAAGSSYIGQFTVVAAADNSVALEPTQKTMNKRELTRLAKSAGPWVMYEKMPSDNHWTFAKLNEAEKEAILPAETLAEFQHDGESATWEKIDEEWKLPGELVDESGKPFRDEKGAKIADSKGKYERPLRDYDVLFNTGMTERVMMGYLFTEIQEDTARLQAAGAEAKLQIVAREKQIASMKDDRTKYVKERDALAGHLASLKKKAAELNLQVNELLASNKATAAQIAKAQLDAARRIDTRTPSVANSAENGK